MSYSRSTVVANVVNMLDEGKGSKSVSKMIAKYLLQNGRISELPSLLRDLSLRNYQKNGIVEVTAISAYELSKTNCREITSYVKNIYPNAKKITVNQKIDSTLIGGVKLELPDKQVDFSIEARLNKLRKIIS